MKHRFFCMLIVISLTIAPSVFAQNSQRGLSVVSGENLWGNYHALIIGINKYKQWPRLNTAVKDATVIRNILVTRYGFDKKNVILRTDKNASRRQITRDLRFLAQSMRKSDNLFVYYAGHGQLDDFTGDGYWIPAEGALKDPSTWVANSYIKAVLSSEKLQAKNVIIIADSCYSGSMLRGGPSLMSLDDRRYREKLVKQAALRSRQVISSGGVEPVADGGAYGHSLFAYYLIDALRKNSREVIDLENLFHTKVWRPVTEIGNQRPNVGRLKTPMDQDGQFVLYNVELARVQSRKIAMRPALKNQKSVAVQTTPQNINAEEEMWKIVQTSTAMEDFKLFLDEYPQSRFKGAAKLKMQQLMRLQNDRPVHAAVRKSVAGQSSASLHRPAPNAYKLALLPAKIITMWGHPDRKHVQAVRAVAELSNDEDRIDLRLTYKKIKGLPENVKLIAGIPKNEMDQIWTKKSLLSQVEPDWGQVQKVGRKIDADLGLLIRLQHGPTGNMDVYLYDFKNGKAYSRKPGIYNYNSLSSSIRSEVLILVEKFFKAN